MGFLGMLNPNLGSFFETGSRNQGVSAHAQWKDGKNRLELAFFGLKSDFYRFSSMLNAGYNF